MSRGNAPCKGEEFAFAPYRPAFVVDKPLDATSLFNVDFPRGLSIECRC